MIVSMGNRVHEEDIDKVLLLIKVFNNKYLSQYFLNKSTYTMPVIVQKSYLGK